MRKILSSGFASPKWTLLGNAKDSIKRSTRTARRSNWRRREWLCIPNSLLFHNRIDRVGDDILQHLHFASGLTDLHRIDFRGGAEARMLTEGVLRQPVHRGNVLLRAIVQVSEQLHRLPVLLTTRNCVHLRVHVTVCDEEIEPASVTEVDKSGSPLYVGIRRLCSLRRPALVRKTLQTKIVIQVVRLVGEISNEDTQSPFVPVVSEVNAHRAEFLSVGT